MDFNLKFLDFINENKVSFITSNKHLKKTNLGGLVYLILFVLFFVLNYNHLINFLFKTKPNYSSVEISFLNEEKLKLNNNEFPLLFQIYGEDEAINLIYFEAIHEKVKVDLNFSFNSTFLDVESCESIVLQPENKEFNSILNNKLLPNLNWVAS